MGLLIISGIVCIISFFLFCFFEYEGYDLSPVISGIVVVASMITLAVSIMKCYSEVSYSQQVVNYKNYITECKELKNKKNIDKFNILLKNIEEYNENIENARKYGDSFWFSGWYDETTKDLPTIDIADYLFDDKVKEKKSD